MASDRAFDPRVLVSQDESLACLAEANRVTVFRLPDVEPDSEVGIADGSSIAMLGDPTRLLVLAPDGALHVIDPTGKDGPVKTATLKLEPGSRIAAASGSFALVTAPGGAVVVSVQDQPSFARVVTRIAAGTLASALGVDNFIVEVGGVLEEWSGPMRQPLRRFRLDQPVSAQFVGGGARQIWFVPRSKPNEITMVPLARAARTQQIDLGEPIARMVADPSGAMIAAIGADTGALMVVGCGDGKIANLHLGRVADVAWRGSAQLAYIAEDGAVRLVELRGSTAEPIPVARSQKPSAGPPGGDAPMSTGQQLAAWKERVRLDREQGDGESAGSAGEGRAFATKWEPVDAIVVLHQWRDALASWARATVRGARGEPPLFAACPLHDVGAALGFEDDERHVLWLLYGARLCGLGGVAPVDLVHLCPNRWDDALGRGRLAATGAFVWRNNLVQLAPEVSAALDQAEPRYGTVGANPAIATRRVAIVATGEPDYAAIGKQAALELGALLVPNARGVRHPAALVLEARARRLAPLVPLGGEGVRLGAAEPFAIVVASEAAARALDLTVALTWSPG